MMLVLQNSVLFHFPFVYLQFCISVGKTAFVYRGEASGLKLVSGRDVHCTGQGAGREGAGHMMPVIQLVLLVT